MILTCVVSVLCLCSRPPLFYLFIYFPLLHGINPRDENVMEQVRFCKAVLIAMPRVIDCSKDRGKSRNVITGLLRSVPPRGDQ